VACPVPSLAGGNPPFTCPQCRALLSQALAGERCACGFLIRNLDGVFDLLSEADAAASEPFLEIYERVRRDEQWGGDDLDLPFRAKRHRDIWNIRKRSFRALESAIGTVPRGIAVDVGAGNCWLTRYLDRWGFNAIALDINNSSADGLQAGQRYLDQGATFHRIRGSMEHAPLDANCVQLLVANASFHYSSDFESLLSEFRRVLVNGGVVALLDTPFYENAIDGERMVAQRVKEFSEKYSIDEAMSRRSSYLTFRRLRELAASVDMSLTIQHVWPGWPRRYREIRGRLAGQQIAQFPLALLRKAGLQ